MAYLEIQNFNKTFPDGLQVLKNINFTLEKGKVLSIIGSSGSGKTTLLKAINFLTGLDGGVMTLDNEVLLDASLHTKETEKTLREKRLNFGLVFQQFNLFPQYSVLKNVTLAPSLLLNERLKKYKKELKAKLKLDSYYTKAQLKQDYESFKSSAKCNIEKDALALLEKIGLIEKKNSYPCELSGGQQQRVAIARALALQPKILCFDEPTSALDPELTGEVLKVIKALKDDDRTMIIVTHEMEFAKNVSDKILYMSNGIIEEEGTPDEIFNNPKSENLKNFLSSINDRQ